MSSAYWLGVLTLPALSAMVAGCFRLEAALRRRGFTATIRWTRRPDKISDYTLSHDVWWERSFGPVFTGGWYHESLRYEHPDSVAETARINRWIGVGRTEGPCLTFFRSRQLGDELDA